MARRNYAASVGLSALSGAPSSPVAGDAYFDSSLGYPRVNDGSNWITLQPVAAFAWAEVTGTTQTLVGDNGYVLNNGSQVVATLPTTCAVGKVIAIVGKGVGGWKIAQGSGQQVHFGSADTTSGTGGYLASTHQRDCIELVCVVANTEFVVQNSQGNITVV